MVYAQTQGELFRSGTQSLLQCHETCGVSMNSLSLPSPPTWPDSNSKLCLHSGGQQLTFLSTFPLLLFVGHLNVSPMLGDLRGIYTQILRLFLLWFASYQDSLTQFPAPLAALNSILGYLQSVTKQASAYFQLLCAFQTRDFPQRKSLIKVHPIQ